MPVQAACRSALTGAASWIPIILAAVLLLTPAKLRADMSPVEAMRFTFQPPRKPVEVFGNGWSIFASGPIDRGAAKRLKQGLAERSVPPNSIVYFNSPGGNLLAGMEFGRVIREARLLTYVGRQNPANDIVSLPGHCFSSCSLAFLGGHFRYLSQGSAYGVHRFSFGGEVGDTTDASQMLSAVIVAYIQEMGVQPGLFSLMTEAGRDDIRILRPEELKSLAVIKDKSASPVWSIEGTHGYLYFKGQRDTEWGPDKIIMYCVGGQAVLGGFFDARGHADVIIKMHAGSILLDNGSIKIPAERMEGPSVKNETINFFFFLTTAEVQQITRAKGIGIAVQFAYEAPTFRGIYLMDITEGREKMAGLLASCPGASPDAQPRGPTQKR